MSIRVGISGASGRMGREILGVCSEYPELTIAAAIVSDGSGSANQPTSLAGISFEKLSPGVIANLDGVIDFSRPEATIHIARLCSERGIPLLVGTTGFTASELDELRKAGANSPILFAPNTSVGVTVLGELASLAQKLLGEGYDIEISEIHHREKKDAPSGTARSLADRLVLEGGLKEKFLRPAKRQTGELGISSLRGGGVVGDHTVYFFGNGERLELTHRAESRALFARGALTLFLRLRDKPAGFYKVRDLLVQS